MKEATIQRINGWGSLLRFVTPALIAIIGTMIIMHLTSMLTSLDTLDNHFTNHLGHHTLLEVDYEHRITVLETLTKLK